MQLKGKYKRAQSRSLREERDAQIWDQINAARPQSHGPVKDQPTTIPAALSRGLLDKQLPNRIPL